MAKLDTDRAKFVRNDGPRVYYQARYIRDNKEINGAFWWGDLYFYHSRDPQKLPPADYVRDTMDCASEWGKPNFGNIMGFVVILLAVVQALNMGYIPGKYLPATVLMALSLCLALYENYLRRRIVATRYIGREA